MHNTIRDPKFVEKLGIGRASAQAGWTRSLEQNLVQLEAEIEGLESRLSIGLKNGVPAAYAGKRVFLPEPAAVLVNVDQAPPNRIFPMNYIVRDGATYEIPIIFPGAGVFVAKYLTVSIYLRSTEYWRLVTEFGPTPANMPYQEENVTENAYYGGYSATKFSMAGWDSVSPQPEFESGTGGYAALNYFWNLLDSKSGVRLADEMMTQKILLTRSRESYQDSISDFSGLPPVNTCGDGGYFEFDVPFVFERDGQANFLFRPITPFLQWAGTENPQSVTVQVELHGFRYATDQDAMQMGALSR